MLRYLIVIVLIISAISLVAQPRQKRSKDGIKGYISGKVVDSTSLKPLEFASVEITNSHTQKHVSGKLTGSNGKFVIHDLPPDTYDIIIAHIGYNTQSILEVKLTPKLPDYSLGTIFLKSKNVHLDEIKIVDDKPIIENKIDKLVYNVHRDMDVIGGDATDVLRKVPMVVLDLDGNLTLRGSEKVKILINEKPSGLFADDVGEALKMFPADEIEAIEVITSPGAKYDGEGAAGIINIVTKKKQVDGYAITSRAFVSNKSNSLHLSGASNIRRFGFRLSANAYYRRPTTGESEFIRNDYLDAGIKTTSQTGISMIDRLGFRGGANAFYDFNAFNSIQSSFHLRGRNKNDDSELEGFISNSENGEYTEYNNHSTSNSNRYGYSWTTDYIRRFEGNKKRKMSIAFQIDGNVSKDDSDTDYSLSENIEQNSNQGLNTEYTLQMDYSHPLPYQSLVEVGAKGIVRDLTSDYKLRYIDRATLFDTLDDQQTDVFSYLQRVYAGYISIKKSFDYDIDIITGLRYEHTSIEGAFDSGIYDSFSNQYDNFFPHIAISKTFSNLSKLSLSYNLRIQRPNLREINPYVNRYDPNNIYYGNPSLNPEQLQQVEIGFSIFKKKTSFNISSFYHYTDDLIERYFISDTSLVAASSYFNLGHKHTFGVNLFGSIKVNKLMEFRGNANIYTYQATSTLRERLSNEAISYHMFLNATIFLPKKFEISLWGFFNSPRYTVQGYRTGYYRYSIGMQKRAFDDKLTVGFRINDPFNKEKMFEHNYSDSTFDQKSTFSFPYRNIGLSISYRFGQLKFKERRSSIKNDDVRSKNEDSEN